MKLLFFIASLFLLASCAHTFKEGDPAEYKLVSVDNYKDDLDFLGLVAAIQVTRAQLDKTPNATIKIGKESITYAQYSEALLELSHVLDSPLRNEEKLKYIEQNFTSYAGLSEKGWGNGFVTGYYAPRVKGSYKKTKTFSEPLYQVPDDLIKVDLPSFYSALPSMQNSGFRGLIRDGQLRGRLVERDGTKVIKPYYSREQIAQRKKLAKVICYVDPIDAFFMQIQGSGEVELPNGKVILVNYADQNGHSYFPIGKALRDKIPIEEMSMQRIEDYLRSVPEKERDRIMNLNPSYVFFRKSDEKSVTAFGVEAQPGRSVAIDNKYLPQGMLSYLIYPDPDDLSKTKSQFVFNHDAGGAIRGPGRVDLFWGHGDLSEALSGGLKGVGQIYLLLPKLDKKSRE